MCSEKYYHLSPGAIMHISKKKKKKRGWTPHEESSQVATGAFLQYHWSNP